MTTSAPPRRAVFPRASRLAGWRAEAVAVAAAGLLALVLAAVVVRLWNADLGVPFMGGGDASFFQMVVKGVLEHGWTYRNPDLGAPFGQQLYDFPVVAADVPQILLVKLLGLFTSSSGEVVNLFFLLTFPLAAMTAYPVLRWLRAAPVTAVAFAVVFAIAPYHFLRGEYHLFLACYFTVPLSAYLVLGTLLGRSFFEPRVGAGASRVTRMASGRSLTTVAICLLVGASDSYYIAFTLLLLVAVTAVAFVVGRRRRTLVTGLVLIAIVSATALVAVSPNLIYRAQHGPNPVAVDRSANQSETFSFNLTELLLPVEGHRIHALDRIAADHQRISLIGLESAPLGFLAACGFLWLLGLAVVGAFAGGRLRVAEEQRALATTSLIAFLIGTTGGVSAVIAYGISGELRTWSRLSIFVGFFALAALALLCDAAWSRLRARRSVPAAAGVAALVGVVLLAFLDQTAQSGHFVQGYDGRVASFHAQGAFVAQVERRLGPGASVFQTPWVRFPDSDPFGGIQDYDPAVGYIHSRHLRWSYGAMKGRPADWSQELADAPAGELRAQVAAAGFAGVWVDRLGYPDHGAKLERTLAEAAGTPLVSPDRRYAFYDLRSYGRALRARLGAARWAALRDVTLRPPRALWASGFAREERVGALIARWSVAPLARITLDNPGPRPRVGALSLSLSRAGGAPAPAGVRFPDGSTTRVVATAAGTPVLRRVVLPPGRSTVWIASSGAPIAGLAGAQYQVRVVGLRFSPIEATSSGE